MVGHAIAHHGRTAKLSRAVVCNGIAWLSGLTAPDRSGGTTEQTRQVLAAADALLSEVGSGRDRLIYAQVWLRDIGDFDAMNTVWLDWIGGVVPPARSTVEARLGLPDITVEIQIVAAAR